MDTTSELVTTITKNGDLVAIIKRDGSSRKHLIYIVREAKTDDIAKLLISCNNKEE